MCLAHCLLQCSFAVRVLWGLLVRLVVVRCGWSTASLCSSSFLALIVSALFRDSLSCSRRNLRAIGSPGSASGIGSRRARREERGKSMPSPGPRGAGGGPRSTFSSATSPRTSRSPDAKRSSMSFVDFVAARFARDVMWLEPQQFAIFVPPTFTTVYRLIRDRLFRKRYWSVWTVERGELLRDAP